jgi:hypothetical protein
MPGPSTTSFLAWMRPGVAARLGAGAEPWAGRWIRDGDGLSEGVASAVLWGWSVTPLGKARVGRLGCSRSSGGARANEVIR